MEDWWRGADGLNEHLLTDEQRARGECYVPWHAIEIRPDILPREEREPDGETVERYVAVFDQLPAIIVQRDTLVLIDGRHRLAAAPRAVRDHIRVIERTVTDDELWIEAFIANTQHGRPLKASERTAMARRLLLQFPDPEGPWPLARIAEMTGVHRSTLYTFKGSQSRTQSVENRHSDNRTINLSVGSFPIPPTTPQFDFGGESDADDEPEPDQPTPPPTPAYRAAPERPKSRPAPKPATDGKQLQMEFNQARALFGDYNPAYLVERYRADGLQRLHAELETWREWIDEALAAARARLGGG